MLLFAFVASACTSITPPPSPEAARIELRLALSKAAAYDRVVAAFVAEGLTPAAGSQDAGLVASVPVDVAPSVPATYRATIVMVDSSSSIALTGTIRNEQGAAMGQYMTGMRLDPGDQPLHSAMTGKLGEAWQRLERVAARLRSDNR